MILRARGALWILLGLVLVFASGWLAGHRGQQPFDPGELTKAVEHGFRPVATVWHPHVADAPPRARAVLHHVADLPSESKAHVLTPQDCPQPEGVPRGTRLEVHPGDLGGSCEVDVFESAGSWWARCSMRVWVDTDGDPPRIERGPLPATTVRVSEVARSVARTRRWGLFLGASGGLGGLGVEAGASRLLSDHAGFYGLAEYLPADPGRSRVHGGLLVQF